MVAIGAICVIFMAAHLSKLRGYLPYDYLGSLAWAVPCALVGGVLLFGVTNIPYLVRVFSSTQDYASFADLIWAVAIAFQGMVFYGGMLGALLGFCIWLGRTKRPKGDYLDMLAVCLPLFHGITRIGCFLGGCCFGIECDFGIVYTTNPIEIANGVPRFPVQLLESAFEFALFGILYMLYRKGSMRGQLLWMWMICYGAIRFCDEFLRGDFYRGFLGPFSTSQWISIVLMLCAIIHFAKRHARYPKGSLRA